MPRYDLVVFDFDGTLADSFAVFRHAFESAARAEGVAPEALAQLDAYRGLEPRALLRRLGLPLWRVPALTLAMRRAMSERLHEVALFEGATDLLRALRRHGVRTALVSSNAQDNAERVLGHKYAAMIDHFGCGATIFGKRRKLREVLAAFEFAPARVLCVGDEIRDAQAAAGLGLDFAGVAWGFAAPAALAAHCRFGPFADFAALQAAILGSDP
jgi:phosphoglycolate phosphatase